MVVALGCGLLPSSPVRVADSRGRLEQRRMCRQSRSSVPPVAVLSSFKSTSPTSKEALAEEVWVRAPCVAVLLEVSTHLG